MKHGVVKKIVYGIGVVACLVLVAVIIRGRKTRTSAEWIAHVNASPSGSSGKFFATDNFDEPVVVEWEKTIGTEQRYSENVMRVADVICQSFIDVEVDFLREYPDLVGKDVFYTSFEPLFADGLDKVDWKGVADTMRELIKTVLLANVSQVTPNDIYFFATVKKATTQELLGAAIFLITPLYAYGDVEVMSIGLKPEAQGRGLGKVLMSSLLKMVPDCLRIVLATRITNHGAQRAYFAWGFTQDGTPTQDPRYKLNKEHWMFFEYPVNNSSRLQDTAQRLQIVQ